MDATYKISIVIFILLLSSLPRSHTSGNTDIIQNLQIDFSRDFSEKDSDESAGGTLYYSFPTSITIHVKEPIEQWMILKKYSMNIYYPADRKAFLFKTENPISLPFFHAFIGVVKKDYGLVDLGYSLAYHRKREPDTLVTVWVPPKKASKVLGDFTLIYVSGKITYAEFKNPKGSILSKTYYGNHCEFEGINFPLSIETVRYTGTDSTIEHIAYSNPHFNTEIPDTILSFTIPDEVITKEFDW